MTCIALETELSLPLCLNAIAHFNHHLGRHCGNDPLREVLRDDYDPLRNVTMKMYRLTTNSAGFRAPDATNLLTDNVARLELDENAEYGFAIFNYSEHDLFPYLFYFDPSDYSIQVRSSSVFVDSCQTHNIISHGTYLQLAQWTRRCNTSKSRVQERSLSATVQVVVILLNSCSNQANTPTPAS